MRSRSRGRIDPGHGIAWFLAGGRLGYGAVSFPGYGTFAIPVGLAVATGAGFVVDLAIRARRRGGDA